MRLMDDIEDGNVDEDNPNESMLNLNRLSNYLVSDDIEDGEVDEDNPDEGILLNYYNG
jgi:hypothetical protein